MRVDEEESTPTHPEVPVLATLCPFGNTLAAVCGAMYVQGFCGHGLISSHVSVV